MEQSRSVDTAAELTALMDEITRDMGFDHFALTHHVDLSPLSEDRYHIESGELLALTTYPDHWIDYYIEHQIFDNDPVWLASETSSQSFQWCSLPNLIDLNDKLRDITERTRRAGLHSGFTVPANVPGENNGSVSFALTRSARLPQENLAMAQMIAAFSFQAAQRLVRQGRRKHFAKAGLTSRQLECIELVARGMSDREIAKSLGVSVETVKKHLEAARRKYGVHKRVQLILQAIYNGDLNLQDLLR